MKITLVRGAFLSPWEMQPYISLASRHAVTAIGADWQFYRLTMELPGILVKKAGVYGGPIGRLSPAAGMWINRALSWTLGMSYGLRGLLRLVGTPDILHSAEVHSTMSYQCLRIKRRIRCALVLTVSENLPGTGDLHPFRRIRKRAVIQEADAFLAITEQTRNMLVQEGVPADRITVIPMSIDTDNFRPAAKDPALCRELGLEPDDTVILYIGRFAPEKGIDDMLAALPQVIGKQTAPKTRFCFVGDGPLKSLIRQAQKRYPAAVRVHPFVSYSQMPAYHNLADIFVLPSKPGPKIQEQFGFVLVESMACGKPVITTRTGSIPEVVGDGAVVVHPGRPDDLAKAIQYLIESPLERERLAKKALAWAVSHYSASRNAVRIEKLYETISQKT